MIEDKITQLSYAVRSQGANAELGPAAVQNGTRFLTNLSDAIAFAQQIEADDYVDKFVEISRVKVTILDLYRRESFWNPVEAPFSLRYVKNYQAIVRARSDGANVIWHLSTLNTEMDAAERFTNSMPVEPDVNAVAYLAHTELPLAHFRLRSNISLRNRQELVAPMKPADPRIPGGPIIGFRCWRMSIGSRFTGATELVKGEETPQVEVDGLDLMAMYNPAVWTAPQVRFVCGRGHETPQKSCKCGLHAYHRLSGAMDDHNYGKTPFVQSPTIIGVVSGHGDVMVHGRGWRAEEAHILAFADFGHAHDREARRTLARRWDVPLIRLDDLQSFAESRGRFISKAQAKLDGGLA